MYKLHIPVAQYGFVETEVSTLEEVKTRTLENISLLPYNRVINRVNNVNMYKLKCIECLSDFEHRHQGTKTCSIECRRKRAVKRSGIQGEGLPTNFLGKLNEYRVLMELSELGIECYYQFLPQSKADAIIRLKNGELKQLEVKTGYMTQAGKINYPKKQWSGEVYFDITGVYVRSVNKIFFFDRKRDIVDMKTYGKK